MHTIKSVCLILCIVIALPLWGADIYVSTTGNDTTGTGAIDAPYATVQKGINECSVGDTIYLRGGTYNGQYDVVIPTAKNGTAWTAGNYTTICSYPGEWAIFDGGGVEDAFITHSPGYGAYEKRDLTDQTSYWKFERFEVTDYAAGFWFSGGPQWYRYLYLHDNTADQALAGAIFVTLPHDCIIEYCYFYNNNQSVPGTNPQYGHIVFDADYRDDELPTTFDPDVCTKKNTVQYNYFNTGLWAAHYKNQQRFGTNTRTPAGVIESYGDWGDKWHHNIIVGCTRNPLLLDQDNIQAYNNIISGGARGAIQFGQEVQLSSDNTMLYNCIAYNNTVIGSGKSFGGNSGGLTQTAHPYLNFYNNISDTNTADDNQGRPFVIAADMDMDYYADLSDTFIKNNLIHANAAATDILRGRADYYTLANAESTFASMSGNWSNSTTGLFAGESGADQYKTVGSFVLSGETTIANGGIGGDHPYLSGVTIPSYVGAVNPSDSDWVAGVLALDATYFTSAEAGSDPVWIEDEGGEISGTTTIRASGTANWR